jgi:hypothetical protein
MLGPVRVQADRSTGQPRRTAQNVRSALRSSAATPRRSTAPVRRWILAFPARPLAVDLSARLEQAILRARETVPTEEDEPVPTH